jgi:hypothetical protein
LGIVKIARVHPGIAEYHQGILPWHPCHDRAASFHNRSFGLKLVIKKIIGGIYLTRKRFLPLVLVCFLAFCSSFAQAQTADDKDKIFVIIRDAKGENVEGYLRNYPTEIKVTTKEKEEKTVPLKLIESIKLEKVQSGVPGANEPGQEGYYTVKMQHSNEIYKLENKYSFSLNTNLGVVTKTIGADPSRKEDPSKPQTDRPFVRDVGIALSLDFKF